MNMVVQISEVLKCLDKLSVINAKFSYSLANIYRGKFLSSDLNTEVPKLVEERLSTLFDIEKSIFYLQRCIALGHENAIYDLVNIYLKEKQINEAFEYFDKLSTTNGKLSYLLVEIFLGRYGRCGIQITHPLVEEQLSQLFDIDKAILYLNRSIDLGFGDAAFDLAEIYLDEDLSSSVGKAYISHLENRYLLPYDLKEHLIKIKPLYDFEQAILALTRGYELAKTPSVKARCAYRLAELYRQTNEITASIEDRSEKIIYYDKAAEGSSISSLEEVSDLSEKISTLTLAKKSNSYNFTLWYKSNSTRKNISELLMNANRQNADKWRDRIETEISSVPDKLRNENENYMQTYIRNERIMDWMLFNLRECPESHQEKMLKSLKDKNPNLDKLEVCYRKI